MTKEEFKKIKNKKIILKEKKKKYKQYFIPDTFISGIFGVQPDFLRGKVYNKKGKLYCINAMVIADSEWHILENN